jgi:putative RNA 2'-phosphotransferase
MIAEGLMIAGVPSILSRRSDKSYKIKSAVILSKEIRQCPNLEDNFVINNVVLKRGDMIAFDGQIIYTERRKSMKRTVTEIIQMCGGDIAPLDIEYVLQHAFPETYQLEDKTIIITEEFRKKASMWLTFGLRRDPKYFGVSDLKQGGYVPVYKILDAMSAHFRRPISYDILWQVVQMPDEHGYVRNEFDEEGMMIRAKHGHMVGDVVTIERDRKKPPPHLLHGTSDTYLKAILEEGLKSMGRKMVHLTPKYDYAISFGDRAGHPVVLVIDTEKVPHPFYHTDVMVWLTKEVPPEAIIGFMIDNLRFKRIRG